LNAGQPGLTYLCRSQNVRGTFDFSVGRIMKIATALGGFLIGFGLFIKVALRDGFWSGLAVMLICFGVTLIGIATADQIASTSRRKRLTTGSGDKVARLLAAYPGPLTLKASRTGWVMMVFAVVLAAAGMAEVAAGLREPAFEMFVYAVLSGLYSACALLWGELRLDKNGFQATLLSHKRYLWTEAYDFRLGDYNGVQFSVTKPHGWSIYWHNKLGDNFGLKADELSDLMESWRSAALDGQE
jgi:hypothetical protein